MALIPRKLGMIDFFLGHRPGMLSLSNSETEPLTQKELLAMADDETKEMWENLTLSYGNPRGLPALRNEVAGMYENVAADNVLLTTSQEGIFLAISALVAYLKEKNEGNLHVVITWPAFQPLVEHLMTLECEISHWSIKKSENAWYFDNADLQSAIRPTTRLLIVNFPHNPTGIYPSESQFLEMVDICRQEDIFLFSDEVYRLTRCDGGSVLPSACSLTENALTLSSLSKVFGLPGLRMGWAVTRNAKLHEYMTRLKGFLVVCSAAPTEVLALIALRNKEKLLKRTFDIIREHLKIADDFFEKHSDIFIWRRPQAGPVAFVEITGWLAARASSEPALAVSAELDKENLLLLPASYYDYDNSYFRLGLGKKSFKKGIQQFEEYLLKLKP